MAEGDQQLRKDPNPTHTVVSWSICTVQVFRLGGGGTRKIFWRGCAAQIFDLPLAKEILVENIPLAKEDFLNMIPSLHDFKEFQPKYSPFKQNCPKTDANLVPKCLF